MLGGHHELLVGVTGVPAVHLLIATGGDRDSLGPLSWPLLSLLMPLFIPLSVAVADVPRSPLGTALLPPCTKIAPTASSPEACLVAMLRSSFVIFSSSQPSSCTKVRQVVLDQNTDITSASHIWRSLCHFLGKMLDIVPQGLLLFLPTNL
jgi:hypothetical protein